MGRPPEYMKARPRPMYIMARVIINGEMRPMAIPTPFINPIADPTASPNKRTGTRPRR